MCNLYVIEIKELDIERLLFFLSRAYSKATKRIWKTPQHIYGVFISHELVVRTFSEQVIYILLEHNRETNSSCLHVSAIGGGQGILRLDWGSQSAAEKTFRERFERLARKYNWKWTVQESHSR